MDYCEGGNVNLSLTDYNEILIKAQHDFRQKLKCRLALPTSHSMCV
jgi:hypothetical protein